MEGSSDSKWEESDSLGVNACVVSNGGLDLFHSDKLGPSGNASNERDRVLLHRADYVDHQVGSSRDFADEVAVGAVGCVVEQGDVNLRQWLDKPERSVDLLECLHIFRQIVEIVNRAHSEGVVVHDVRPSCFSMSTFNRVSFVESISCSSRDGDSYRDALKSRIAEAHCCPPLLREFHEERSRTHCVDSTVESSPADASQRGHDIICLQSSSTSAMQQTTIGEIEDRKFEDRSLDKILDMEISWYASPEEVSGTPSSFSSDIYKLGVLLFELFCTFSSTEEKINTMSNLRHRVLPSQLLLDWPREASFCLWLLHPHSSTRPKMSELLQSEFLNEPREEHEATIKLREEIEEQELMLEFLLQMQQRKRESGNKLHYMICCLSADIEEVLKQRSIVKKKGGSFPEFKKDDHSAFENVEYQSGYPFENEYLASLKSRSRKRSRLRLSDEENFDRYLGDVKKIGTLTQNQESIWSKSACLLKNFKILESTYFSTRCMLNKPTEKSLNKCSEVSGNSRGSIVRTGGSSGNYLGSNEGNSKGKENGLINPFLQRLCKYLSFSQLKVRADLHQGDLLNSSNLVCSLSFDRDKEFFATAGVNRKIKVFEYDLILNKDRVIHYPVIEMACRSKLSSICWNSYIKSHIASSDFEGVVQIWDATRGQVFMDMTEHERRVWSVDFSLADPTNLASGSDDGAVKLWNINQAILFLHLVDVSFETKRTGVIKLEEALILSKQRPMSAAFNSLLILHAHLYLVPPTTRFIAMIFVTQNCHGAL